MSSNFSVPMTNKLSLQRRPSLMPACRKTCYACEQQKFGPWKWIALNTMNSMPRQLHPRGTSWEAGQLQSSDLTLTHQTTNVRPHTQWTKTYSWHHKFVHDCFIFYWLVVFFVFLFFVCSVLCDLFAAVHVSLIYGVRWSVVASVQSKMFVLQYAVFLSSMGCTAVNTWCKFFSWLAGVSSWPAGVSSWLARVSSWPAGVSYWLAGVFPGWLQSFISHFLFVFLCMQLPLSLISLKGCSILFPLWTAPKGS